jgi:hypothetical protein
MDVLIKKFKKKLKIWNNRPEMNWAKFDLIKKLKLPK